MKRRREMKEGEGEREREREMRKVFLGCQKPSFGMNNTHGGKD